MKQIIASVRAFTKGLLLSTALVLTTTSALAQQGPGVTDKEIRLGAWIPLTGPLAAYGVPYRAGLDAYLNMVNDRGGINGRKINLIIEDNLSYAIECIAPHRKILLFDRPWNQADKLPNGIIRVHSWKEIANKL